MWKSNPNFARLSQAPAPSGLSLALLPKQPATRPGRPKRKIFFPANFQSVINSSSQNQAKSSYRQLDWVKPYFKSIWTLNHIRQAISWYPVFDAIPTKTELTPANTELGTAQPQLVHLSIAKFQIRMRPNLNSGHDQISIFQLQNFKSGHVRSSILDLTKLI